MQLFQCFPMPTPHSLTLSCLSVRENERLGVEGMPEVYSSTQYLKFSLYCTFMSTTANVAMDRSWEQMKHC